MKKYELIKETETCSKRRIMYRIRALKDFSDIKAGDVGGWVCSYGNLSQEGDCWIYDNAKCLDNARVYDNAMMFDNTIMFGNSVMYDNAVMLNNSIMYDNSKMFNNSKMYDEARMYDNAVMFNDSIIYSNSRMYGNAVMYDTATMGKDKLLYGSINKSYKKIFQYHCEKRLLIAILTEVNEILYSVGCQIGMTKEEFIDRIYNDCEVKGKGLEEYPYRQEYLDMIDMAENYLKKFI